MMMIHSFFFSLPAASGQRSTVPAAAEGESNIIVISPPNKSALMAKGAVFADVADLSLSPCRVVIY